MTLPDARLADDSDSQWAALERERIRPDRILARYWAAIPGAERERIAAAVPDGYRITITAGHRAKPGTADVRLLRHVTSPVPHWLVEAEARGQDLARLCRDVLPRVVVTTDAAGYVTSIEEVA